MAQAELDVLMQELRARPFSLDVPEPVLRAGIDAMADMAPLPEGVTLSEVEIGGVRAERLAAGPGPIVLFFHGGGYVIGSPKSHRAVTSLLAKDIAGEVFAIDYRLAPESPFPAALDDALSAYQALCSQHAGRPIVLVGDSAGGGLVFATALAIRDRGLPAPAGLVGISPWVNLETDNESYDLLADADPMLSRDAIQWFASRYLAGTPAREPLASPIYGALAGLSPTLIQVGDHECFLGDAVSFHQRLISAGVDTELRVWRRMFHVWHLYWPRLGEGREAIAEIAGFIQRVAGAPARGAQLQHA